MSNAPSSSKAKLPKETKIEIKKAIFKKYKIQLEKNSETFIANQRTAYLEWVRNQSNENKTIEIKTFRSFFDPDKIDSANYDNTVRQLCQFFLGDTPEEWLKKHTDETEKNINSEYLPPEHWTGIERIERKIAFDSIADFIKKQLEKIPEHSKSTKIFNKEVWLYEGHFQATLDKKNKEYTDILLSGTTLKFLMLNPLAEQALSYTAEGIDRNVTLFKSTCKTGFEAILFLMFRWKKILEEEYGNFEALQASQIQVRLHNRVPFSRCYLVHPTNPATKSLLFPTIDNHPQSDSPGYVCNHKNDGLIQSYYFPEIKNIWEKESISLYNFDENYPEYSQSKFQYILNEYKKILRECHLSE